MQKKPGITRKKEGLRVIEGSWCLLERAVNRSIPVLVILLAVVIVLDNPLWEIYDLERFETSMLIFDFTISFFFVTDLIFKWQKVRKLNSFIKLYWIDIVAVFPFYLGFRAYHEITYLFELGEEIAESAQKLTHEAVILKETEVLRELRETKPMLKIVKCSARMLKIIKARALLTHWHLHEISRKQRQIS